MLVRKATMKDALVIRGLLEQLNYPVTDGFIAAKLPELLVHPDQELLVCEFYGRVAGFVSLHFLPQLAFSGEFAVISCFVVDRKYRSRGIGTALEAYCTRLAGQRGCERIGLHCHLHREDALRFYERQGYRESKKYLIKKTGK